MCGVRRDAAGDRRRAVGGATGRALAAALAFLLSSWPAGSGASQSCAAEDAGIAAQGGDAVDAYTQRLAGGAELRLAGIAAPWKGAGADAARGAVQQLAGGKALKVLPSDIGSDRHGRLPAQIFAQSGDSWKWVQGELVAMGLARVEPFADNHGCAARLLKLEAAARGKGRGLWRDPAYAVRNADDLAGLNGLIDSFQIIEGRVLSVASSGRHIYLNFGRHWKSDFTARLISGKADEFRAAGHDLLGLAGRTVRVRGWLEERGGPMIELELPMQLELVGKED